MDINPQWPSWLQKAVKKTNDLFDSVTEKKSRKQNPEAFLVRFKISFPCANGTFRETSVINISVPADTPELAIEKLEHFVRAKIKVLIVDISPSQKTNNI